jgi:hypothetical protein
MCLEHKDWITAEHQAGVQNMISALLLNDDIKGVTAKDVAAHKAVCENISIMSFLTLQDNNLSNFIDKTIKSGGLIELLTVRLFDGWIHGGINVFVCIENRQL